jgi:hypothetical protein
MVLFKATHAVVFRYDEPLTSDRILAGSIRVSTLGSCRAADRESCGTRRG